MHIDVQEFSKKASIRDPITGMDDGINYDKILLSAKKVARGKSNRHSFTPLIRMCSVITNINRIFTLSKAEIDASFGLLASG